MKMDLRGMAELISAGKPLEIALADILEDPNNYRDKDKGEADDPQAIQEQLELNANIKARGVKTPISVRPHPTIQKKFLINYGHRRYRAAKANGFLTIPAFVDESFSSFDQVNENLHRRNLTLRSMALFIQTMLEEGQTKGEIAAGLQKDSQNFITEHLALIDAPDCVNQAYAKGVKSARTLYDLRRLWEEYPEQVDAWCASGARVTRDSVSQLGAKLRHDVKTEQPIGPAAASGGQADELRHDVKPDAPTTTTDAPPEIAATLRHDVKDDDEPHPPSRSCDCLECEAYFNRKDEAPADGLIYASTSTSSAPTAQSPMVVTPPSSSTTTGWAELRHDVKKPQGGREAKQRSAASTQTPGSAIIMVEHKGKIATVLPSSMVKITYQGEAGTVVEVPLAEVMVTAVK